MTGDVKMAGWRMWLAIAALLFVVIYLAWSYLHASIPKAGVVFSPPPAVTASKIEGPKVKVPLKIVPPKAVEKKFPQLGPVSPSNPVIDTTKIPKTDNGGLTVTFLNVTTGVAETKFIPSPAPWFTLEDRNELSAGMEWGYHGRRVPVEYRRDILQIKGLHLMATGGGKVALDPGQRHEWHVGVRAAYRW